MTLIYPSSGLEDFKISCPTSSRISQHSSPLYLHERTIQCRLLLLVACDELLLLPSADKLDCARYLGRQAPLPPVVHSYTLNSLQVEAVGASVAEAELHMAVVR